MAAETLHTKRNAPRRRSSRIGRATIESVRIALESLRANTLRTVLTMLGIVIGVASVVALVAIGNGAAASVQSQIASNGSNLLTVSPGQAMGGGAAARTQAQTLTLADAEALAELPTIDAVAPTFQGSAQIVAGTNNSNATVLGITANYPSLRNLTIEQGSGLSETQVRESQSLAVLGSSLAEDLFGSGAQAVNNPIRINGQSFQVIGVLKERGGGPGGSVDDQAFVPIGVAQLKLFGAQAVGSASHRVSSVSVQVGDVAQMDLATSLIEATLRSRHKLAADGSDDDFSVFNQADILETLNQTTSILTAFLGAIAGISLFVGGIGVMNIMLVSVTERTKEIGLRKAVGARRRDILQQFLVEAMLVSAIGGLLGIGFGMSISLIVRLTGLLSPVITVSSVALAFGFAVAVGLFFGIYPAQRAAKLRPIEALRYD